MDAANLLSYLPKVSVATRKNQKQLEFEEAEIEDCTDSTQVKATKDINAGGKVLVKKGTHGKVLASTTESRRMGRTRVQFVSRADGGKPAQAIMVHPNEITEIELEQKCESRSFPCAATAPVETIEELSLEELEEDALTLGSRIGQGRFKSVYTGYHKDHGPVAVLRIEAEAERNEARMLGLLASLDYSYLHFPELFGAKEDPSGGLLLAQEISLMGSVRSVLREPDLAPLLTPMHRLHIAQQTAAAVDFLEAARIIHTDIACRNVLIYQLEDDPELTTVKLTDFGLAVDMPPNTDHITSRTPQATRWCAPETVAYMTWSYKTDVWSLGASLWELFAGGVSPWASISKRGDVAKKLRQIAEGMPNVAEQEMVSKFFPAPEPGVFPEVAHTVVLSCLRVDPAMRGRASSVAEVFDALIDLSMIDGQAQKIDAGLQEERASNDLLNNSEVEYERMQVSATSPPAHERSRIRNSRQSSNLENLQESAGTSSGQTVADLKHDFHADSPAVKRQLPASETRNDPCSKRNVNIEEWSPEQGTGIRVDPPPLIVASTPSTADTSKTSEKATLTSVQRSLWKDQVLTGICSGKVPAAGSNQDLHTCCPVIRRESSASDTRNSQGNGSTGEWTSEQGSSTSATPLPQGIASTPSTADSSKPHEKSRITPAHTLSGKSTTQFEALKNFLLSIEAAQLISQDKLQAMQEEISSAQVREAYWAGVASEYRELAAKPVPGSNMAPRVPESCRDLPLEPQGYNSWRLREPQNAPVQSGRYTLWTYVSPSLRREDFGSELEARTVLNSRNGSQSAAPCVLRDPHGKVLGGTCWRSMCA
jgi:serine/threonine protein kinase